MKWVAGILYFKRILIPVLLITPIHASVLLAQPSEAGGGISLNGWAAVFKSRIELSRSSRPFPWNDEEINSHIYDRLAFMGGIAPYSGLEIFLKGATGRRGSEDGVYENRLILEQGHIYYGFFDESVRCRLFLRERAFYTDHKLLQMVSDDSPFIQNRGEGLRLELSAGGVFKLLYIESILRDEDDVFDHGGIPVFRGGGDIYRLLRGTAGHEGYKLGLMLSETRSTALGDAVMLGVDLGAEWRGIGLSVEFAKTSEGPWENLREESLLGIDPRKFKLGEFSRMLSGNNAFAVEVSGLDAELSGVGELGLFPGHRYSGGDFIDPQGEVGAGYTESYIEGWWKHGNYEASMEFRLFDRYEVGLGTDKIGFYGSTLLGLIGGVSLRKGVFLREGDDPSLFLSLKDESHITRMIATARLDGAGDKNQLSFLAEGDMRLGDYWTLRTVLYLYRTSESYYSVGLEFRPGRRYLVRADLGSFSPFDEAIAICRMKEYDPPPGDRLFSIYSRIWFGDL